VGPEHAETFAVFADTVRSSCLAADDATILVAALDRFAGDRTDGSLGSLARMYQRSAAAMLRGEVANPALIDDCRPWIEAFELGAQAIRRIADLARDGRLDSDAKAELIPYLARLRDARVRVFGDALDMTLSDLTDTHTRPGHKLALHRGGAHA
jgi:hyaluronoglucosaminidase